MSRHSAKLFKTPLVLASAAFVLHVTAATAADSKGDIQQQNSKGDIQQQMRELLTGTPTTHFVPQSGPREGKAITPTVDSQEFVKQLLLGTAAYRVGGAQTSHRAEVSGASGNIEAQKHPVASIDMQGAVRQLLLGQPHAKDAS